MRSRIFHLCSFLIVPISILLTAFVYIDFWWYFLCYPSSLSHYVEHYSSHPFLILIAYPWMTLAFVNSAFLRCSTLNHWSLPKFHITVQWMISAAVIFVVFSLLFNPAVIAWVVYRENCYLIHNCSGLKRCCEKVNGSAYHAVWTRLANSFFYLLLHFNLSCHLQESSKSKTILDLFLHFKPRFCNVLHIRCTFHLYLLSNTPTLITMLHINSNR